MNIMLYGLIASCSAARLWVSMVRCCCCWTACWEMTSDRPIAHGRTLSLINEDDVVFFFCLRGNLIPALDGIESANN